MPQSIERLTHDLKEFSCHCWPCVEVPRKLLISCCAVFTPRIDEIARVVCVLCQGR